MRPQDEDQGNRKKKPAREISGDQRGGQQQGKNDPVFSAWINGRQNVSRYGSTGSWAVFIGGDRFVRELSGPVTGIIPGGLTFTDEFVFVDHQSFQPNGTARVEIGRAHV